MEYPFSLAASSAPRTNSGKKGIGDRRNDHSDGVTFLGAQTAGDPVGTILQLFDHPQNPVSRRIGNARFAIDDRRDGLDRDFGDPSNVGNGDFTKRTHWGDER